MHSCKSSHRIESCNRVILYHGKNRTDRNGRYSAGCVLLYSRLQIIRSDRIRSRSEIQDRRYVLRPARILLSSQINKTEVGLFIPVQWNYLNRQRRDLYTRLKNEGYRFVNVIAPNAIIHSGGTIGDNCWISDGTVIESFVTIGNNVFVKSKAWIGHYTTVEDHSFIGAASMIAGKVVVGEQSFIGINAMVFDGVRIGRKCLVGACTVVKRSLPDYSRIKTATGNSEIKQYDESSIEEKLVAAKNIR